MRAQLFPCSICAITTTQTTVISSEGTNDSISTRDRATRVQTYKVPMKLSAMAAKSRFPARRTVAGLPVAAGMACAGLCGGEKPGAGEKPGEGVPHFGQNFCAASSGVAQVGQNIVVYGTANVASAFTPSCLSKRISSPRSAPVTPAAAPSIAAA